MRLLRDILYKSGLIEVTGSTDLEISSVCFDSRKVVTGSMFVAVKGTLSDGHLYIDKTIEAGAVAVVCEDLPSEVKPGIVYIKVKDSALALGYISANFYDNPSEKLSLIGVTGTNGKTTTVTLLHHLYMLAGFNSGMLSTVHNKIGDATEPATHTTPDPVQLNFLLNKMVEAECKYCFMEVSSHAVVQHRITGLKFSGGIFTNITRDHLDYHKTFEEYIKAKKGFFDMLPAGSFALINIDDRNGNVMVQNTKATVYSYSLKSMSDYRAKVLESNFSGLWMNMDGNDIFCKLIGNFNAYNLLCVYSASQCMGLDKLQSLTFLSTLEAPEGRFEYIISGNKITGIVDYAHTPDALQNVLNTIKDIRTGNEQVITVVGCGGDRDAGKRPQMAAIACELSDKVILTSDNPRSEDPQLIIDQMRSGVPVHHRRKTTAISDRKEAVSAAVNMARPGDIILLAGKGHEKYQEIKGVKYPFDDKQVLEESLMIH
ncbi:MAG: UDP-N-acetylmuramoyl-L-alanyl-D-glutamate--2,6-diaminopimelate ligase [Bacteroidota bacterium]